MRQRADVAVENKNSFDVKVEVDITWVNGDESQNRSFTVDATKGSFVGDDSWTVVARKVTAESEGTQNCSKVIKSLSVVARPA